MATYRELERSLFRSKPVELYHFFRGTEDWYYTSSKFVVSFSDSADTGIYDPLAIVRGAVDLGGADKPGALSITLPVDCDLGLLLQAGTSPTPISVRVIRFQTEAPDEPAIIFTGDLGNADIQDEKITLQCWPFGARLNRTVPRGLYQRAQCQVNTYDPFTCGVDKATYTYEGEVTAINGLAITVDGAADFDPGTGTRPDMFALGILQFGEHLAAIDTQSDDAVTLWEAVPGLQVGDTVQLVAGDDRLQETCTIKFGNAPRRIAFPNMPVDNPFFGQGFRR